MRKVQIPPHNPFYHIDTSKLNFRDIEELYIIFTLIVYNMENEWQIIGLQDAKICTAIMVRSH